MNSENDFDEDDCSDGWDDCEAPEELIVGCLFCDNTFQSCDEMFVHCTTSHNFDIALVKDKLTLDCFSYIRLINYIRKEKPSATTILVNKQLRDVVSDDAYLLPVIQDDPLLMFDIEGLITSSITVSGNTDGNADPQLQSSVNMTEYNRLQDRLKETENRLRESEMQLMFATEQIEKMKSITLERLKGDEEAFGRTIEDDVLTDNVDEEGNGYFSSYAHYSIHHEMLQDEVRTLAYRDAIMKNKDVFKDRTILDVGCGTAILSMFASQSGASRVYGVDQSEIIYRAMDIVRENHMEDCVTLLKGRMEDVNIEERVDVIVSEWMGYFLLFESMLDTVIYTRDRHLKQDGLMLPSRSVINIAGICDTDAHSKLVSYWDHVYGFKMNCLKAEVVQEANIEIIANDKLITEPCLVKDLDLMVCTVNDVEFSTAFQLEVLRDGILTGFVGWFDVHFDLPNAVSLSTSPFSHPTHWKQTVFYLLNPFTVNKGCVLDGRISCKRLPTNKRCLKVQLDFNNTRHTYFLQ